MVMQPAVVALAIALFLFSFVYTFPPTLFYASITLSAVILVYGLATKDLPLKPFEDEEERD